MSTTVDQVSKMASVLSEEQSLLLASIPSYVLGFLLSLSMLLLIVSKASSDEGQLSKPRHVFQAYSLFNSLVGLFFGVYGIIFTLERLDVIGDLQHHYWLYVFVWHRFLLLTGEILPSIDRCWAVTFPLKYYMHATTTRAVAVVSSLILLSVGFTALTWVYETVPDYAEQHSFPLFFLLVRTKFAYFLSIPYLILFTTVLVCDLRALSIAVVKRRAIEGEASSSNAHMRTTCTGNQAAEVREDGLTCQMTAGGTKVCKSDQRVCEADVQSNWKRRRELQVSIRCLATSMWFFCSQLCTFLPAIVFLGCQEDQGSDSSEDLDSVGNNTVSSLEFDLARVEVIERQCDGVLSIYIRIFIFFFYQFQFLKPLFFYRMDADLRKAVKSAVAEARGCCQGNSNNHHVNNTPSHLI